MQAQSYDNLCNHNKNDHYMVQGNSGLKCICEMCSCGKSDLTLGKHQCPKKMPKTDFETSYSRYYQKPKQIITTDQRPPFRYEERHYSPDVLKTNYQQQFQPQPYLQPESGTSYSRLQQAGKNIMAPQVPFIGVSSYKDQYQSYNLVKRQQFQNPEMQILQTVKNHQYRKPVAKFQGISSYKSEFLAPPEPKKLEPKPAYKIPDAPFYGSTSYKQQYKPVEIIPYEYKAQSSPYKNFKTVRFEGQSAYKEQFLPYQQQMLNQYDSRISRTECKLDSIVVPKVNYINDKDHVLYDPETNKFY